MKNVNIKKRKYSVRGYYSREKIGFAYLLENGEVSSATHYVRIFERLGLSAGDGIQYYDTGRACWEIVLCPL